MRVNFSLITICLTVLLSLLQAQDTNEYSLTLQKRFISWSWLANLQTHYQTGKTTALRLSNQYASNLYRQSGSNERWKDENSLTATFSRQFMARLRTETILTSRILSDQNTNVKFNKHLLAQNISWQPVAQVRLEPALGWTTEESFGSRDQAVYTKMGLRLSKIDMGGYINSTDLNSEVRFFPGRKNQDHSLFTAWNKAFSEFARDSLRVGYQYSESRYFINPLASLLNRGISAPSEQVIINAQFLLNELQYLTTKQSRLAILTTFRNRSLDQLNPDTALVRQELSLENQLQFIYAHPRFQLQNGITFSQTDRDNPGSLTDINALQTTFTSSFRLNRGAGSSLWTRFSFAKFEYNTPNNGSDAEDRDEQRFILDTGYAHRFSPHYLLILRGNVYLFHQIYLRSGRSQNNNWNRIFQLSGAFRHQPAKRLSHQSELKILANYTVFDFDELLLNVNSFLFRKLIYSDSLTIDLTKNLNLGMVYQLEKEDNGTFFQKNFSQQVVKELSAHFFSINLQHRDIAGLQVNSGISFFVRDEWNFRPERLKTRKFRSFTPRLSILYPAGRNLMLFLNYAPNRAVNSTRTFTNPVFSRNEQQFSSGTIQLRYIF